MDSSKSILFFSCVIIATLTYFTGCVTSYAYENDDDVISEDEYGLLPPMAVGKRGASNSFCRRCRFDRDDWMSCSLCYGRPRGIVPYYGKRSPPPPAEYDDDGGADDIIGEVKRSRTADSYFLDSRCCQILSIRECCRRRAAGKRGYHTVYFPDDFGGVGGGGYETVKRDYETSFFPIEGVGNGQCSCCDGPLLDYSCCSLSCSKRK